MKIAIYYSPSIYNKIFFEIGTKACKYDILILSKTWLLLHKYSKDSIPNYQFEVQKRSLVRSQL